MAGVLVSTLLALSLSEGLLRLRYATLPSLAPLAESPYHFQPFEWSDYPRNQGYHDDRTTCFQEGYLQPDAAAAAAEEPSSGLSLWVVGDSMSVGVGLPPGASWASLARAELAQRLQQEVSLRNLASPGANFCTVLHILEEALGRHPAPDVVVVQLFADDLHGRDQVAVGGRRVMFPDWVESPALRAAVSRSYLANLVWYQVAPDRHALPVRFVDDATQAMFVDSLRRLEAQAQRQGFALIVTLFEPTGLSQCPDPPPLNSRCMWARPDLALIADIARRAGVDFVDLSAFWDDQPPHVLASEVKDLAEGRLTMGIHPDAQGHRLLADALTPRILARIEGAPGK